VQEIFACYGAIGNVDERYTVASFERRCVLWEAIFGGLIDGLQLAFRIAGRGRLRPKRRIRMTLHSKRINAGIPVTRSRGCETNNQQHGRVRSDTGLRSRLSGSRPQANARVVANIKASVTGTAPTTLQLGRSQPSTRACLNVCPRNADDMTAKKLRARHLQPGAPKE